jgi:hypothetical protein
MSDMRPISKAQVRGLLALATGLLGLLVVSGTDVALGDGGCPDPANPELAPALSSLSQAIGPAMGSPAQCPRVDANGNTIQVTTTGLAIYKLDGTSIFASGEQHWSLTAAGLQTWRGNWHNGLYPPVAPSPSQPPTDAAQVGLASVQPMMVVQVVQDQPNTVLLEDRLGGRFAVHIDVGCPDLTQTVGEQIFMRSQAPETDLILVQQHESCAVASMRVADAD